MGETLVDILLSDQGNGSNLKDDANAILARNQDSGGRNVIHAEGDVFKACPGIIFQDHQSQEKKFTCYFVVKSYPQNFEDALTTCEAAHPTHQSKLAFIKTKNSFDAVVAYLRQSLLAEEAVAHVWLGGNYDPEVGGASMTWHDGEQTVGEDTW